MTTLFRRTDKEGKVISQNWNFSLNGQRKSTGCPHKREAMKIAEIMLSKERTHKVAGLTDEATIGEVVQRYVDRQTLMSDTGGNQARAFQKKLTGTFPADELYRVPNKVMPYSLDPKRKWSSMTNRDLDLIMTNRKLEGYANATINKDLDYLATIQKACRKKWAIKINHDLDFEDLKLPVAQKFRAASQEEEQRLIDTLNPMTKMYLNKCTWDKAPRRQRLWAVDTFQLLIVYLDTGVRSAEGRSIRWDEVDTVNWVGLKIWRNKTKRYDMLQMTDRLREVIQSRYKYKEVRDSVYVFPHAFDTDKPRTGYLGALRNGIDKAGLNDPELVRRYGKFTVHSLRDSYATRLTEQGIVPSELMHLLGHANEEMSMKYIHMRPKDAIAKGTKMRNGIAGELPSTLDQSLVDAYEGNRL